MEIRVNATRMELLKLKRRLELARRGHKLLKDKLDGLVQNFIKTSKELRHLYDDLKNELIDSFSRGTLAVAEIQKEAYQAALLAPTIETKIESKMANLMGVKVPLLNIRQSGELKSFGDMFFTDDFISSLEKLNELLPRLIKLAELYKTLFRIGNEIIEIKRRVNALEYVLIPELEEKGRFIKMKLAEMERGTIVSLLKIKDIVRKET